MTHSNAFPFQRSNACCWCLCNTNEWTNTSKTSSGWDSNGSVGESQRNENVVDIAKSKTTRRRREWIKAIQSAILEQGRGQQVPRGSHYQVELHPLTGTAEKPRNVIHLRHHCQKQKCKIHCIFRNDMDSEKDCHGLSRTKEVHAQMDKMRRIEVHQILQQCRVRRHLPEEHQKRIGNRKPHCEVRGSRLAHRPQWAGLAEQGDNVSIQAHPHRRGEDEHLTARQRRDQLHRAGEAQKKDVIMAQANHGHGCMPTTDCGHLRHEQTRAFE